MIQKYINVTQCEINVLLYNERFTIYKYAVYAPKFSPSVLYHLTKLSSWFWI